MPDDARAIASAFRLIDPPPGFVDDPYPVYAALRNAVTPDGSGPGPMGRPGWSSPSP